VDELGAELYRLVVLGANGGDAAAEPTARLQNCHIDAFGDERARCG
jgi:hypothetical protein